MSPATDPSRIPYIARITNVREVSLWGTADLSFWQAFLRPYGLRPYSASGTAHLVISASALVWKGLAFRELIITVATCIDPDHPQPDSFYLVQGFNSSSILAWAERRLFTTPYAHADIRVNQTAPRVELQHQRRSWFEAQMIQAGEPSTRRDDHWSGPVFLPAHGATEKLRRSHFFVALSGEQAIYPFAAGTDIVAIALEAEHPVFQWLNQSQFSATEWRIRAIATHARSKTYRHDGGVPPALRA